MELLLALIIWGVICYGIYIWAESKGHNPWIFIALAIITPIIPMVILLFMPETLEKQAEEKMKLDNLLNKD